MSFTFPLEALLAQRRAVENAKRQILARAQGRLDEIQVRLNRLESDFSARVNAWDPDSAATIAELERSIAELRAVARRYSDEADAARAALLPAMRDRKALELLKKRRLAEFAARQARKEERELDEANQA
ncbi:MAG TPA: flagellar FliJ family protein [Candidatus Rubrimentiphilum sp.]|nr:flagellar FliJ family protein [Candidatus Rubrimentiphilum sp.]